jgi:hypothetical protein
MSRNNNNNNTVSMDYHASSYHISTYITPLVSILCRRYSNYLINGMIFDTKNILHAKPLPWLSQLSRGNFLNTRRIQRHIITYLRNFSCKAPVYPFITNTEYRPIDFCKKSPVQNLMKIRPGRTTLFRINRHMIKQQVTVALFNSANAPKPDA